MATKRTRLELVEGTSSKFWEAELDGATYTVRWGRIGTAGQEKTKTAASADVAAKEVGKLVAEKTGKGYREVSAPAGAAPAEASAPARVATGTDATTPPATSAPARAPAPAEVPAAGPPSAPAGPAPAHPSAAGDGPAGEKRYQHVSIVEALREPERVTHLHLTKPSAFDPFPPDEVAAIPRLGELRGLESLRLDYTGLGSSIPPLGGLGRLRKLSLTGNELEALPAGVLELAELESLDLSSNPRLDLGRVLTELARLPRLRALVLGDRAMVTLPDALAALPRLEKLDLHVASPAAIGPVLARMPALRILYLRAADEQGLPALLHALAGAPALRVLWLSGSRRSPPLPPELGELVQLERLHVSGMPLESLPSTVAAMTALRIVDIGWGHKIKGHAKKKTEALAPAARFYWEGKDKDGRAPPPVEPYGPELEVRRVPSASGLSAFEELWGRRFPEGVEANPATPQVLPPASENAFEWLVARDQDGSPWYLHLLPFFLDCVPSDDSLPNGDLTYAHLDPRPSSNVEHYLLMHDEGGPLPLFLIGDDEALTALWKRADRGEIPTASRGKARGRVAALIERSRWLMDLLARGETRAPVRVADDDALAAIRDDPGFADDPADMLYWLWSAYLGGKDAWILGLVELAEQSKSRVVRDAAKTLRRIHDGKTAADRALGKHGDLAALKRPA